MYFGVWLQEIFFCGSSHMWSGIWTQKQTGDESGEEKAFTVYAKIQSKKQKAGLDTAVHRRRNVPTCSWVTQAFIWKKKQTSSSLSDQVKDQSNKHQWCKDQNSQSQHSSWYKLGVKTDSRSWSYCYSCVVATPQTSPIHTTMEDFSV